MTPGDGKNKMCNACLVKKPKDMFWKDAHNADGLCKRCKQCYKDNKTRSNSGHGFDLPSDLGEEWRIIAGASELYYISSKGRVASEKRFIRKGDCILPQFINDSGYPAVSLQVGGKSRTKRIHRLVAIAFIPNPENKKEVNHKNGIKSDYSIENLEWATHRENVQHSFDNLPRKISKSNRKLTDEQVVQIRLRRAQNPKITAREIAKDSIVNEGQVAKILRGECFKELQIIEGVVLGDGTIQEIRVVEPRIAEASRRTWPVEPNGPCGYWMALIGRSVLGYEKADKFIIVKIQTP